MKVYINLNKHSFFICLAIAAVAPFLTTISDAQLNLVSNPSFEEMDYCFDATKNYLNGVKYWRQWSGRRPLHLADCKDNTFKNMFDEPYARTGKASIAFYLLNLEHPSYRMFLQSKLATPLETGKRYQIEFFVKLAKKANMAVNKVGIFLSIDSIGAYPNRSLIQPQIQYTSQEVLGKEWNKITGEYLAAGGERHLTIGNFAPQADVRYQFIHKQNQKGYFNVAYYFIDDVSITEVETEIKTGQTITLEDVLFKVSSAELMKRAHDVLDKLIFYLKNNLASTVMISGHTDNSGSEIFNKKLSLNRAYSVKQYLITQGIAASRSTIQGFGSSKPVVKNDDKQTRSKNRRVEIAVQ
ncbi:MAG: OmpA family protein [Ferruginibacter sp.]|nr:OmpA family protein [Cytophagales bacterium]